MRFSGKSAMIALGVLASTVLPAIADPVVVRDVTGRDVEVNVPGEKVEFGPACVARLSVRRPAH